MPTTVRLPADDLGATTMRFNDIRGHRYAEIILIGGDPAGP